jgi:DNA-binding Lrp family transcriptional regulator|tara:strand:- start:169 stop:552 length:384 start_codon:yes stop_codon:yes gene_type:complete
MLKEKKMKVLDIQALGIALMSFEKAAEGQGISAKLGYKMARFRDEVAKVSETIEKQRQEIFKKHGVEKDGQVEIPKKNVEKFNKDITAFLTQEDSIRVLSEPVSIEEFGDIKLPPSFMNVFKEYIEE